MASSTNWSRGLLQLGEGLQKFAGVRLQKEENEIEQMRREALMRVGQQHDVAMAERREKHDVALTERGEKHRLDLFEKETKARGEEDQRRFGRESALLDKRTLAEAIEQANREYSAQMIAIQNHRKALDVEKAKLVGQGYPPEALAGFDQLYIDLDEQAKQAKQNFILTTRRLQTGGYGKTEMMTAEEVAKLFEGKEPNTADPVVPAEPVAPTVSPLRPPGPGKPEPAASSPGAELFMPTGNPMLERMAEQANTLRDIETRNPRPGIGEVVSRVGSRMAEQRTRLKAEAEARRRRDEELRHQIQPRQ